MLPKVIIHNDISLDGYINGYDSNIKKYYEIAAAFNADTVLIGSNTMKSADEEVRPETKSDFIKPVIKSNDERPYLVIPDSRGILRNLHMYRNSEYGKDVILLVSKNTPQSYLEYLKKRNYDTIVTGKNHVDYRMAFEILYERYKTRVIRSDSGGILNNILLEQGLVDEISLLISPVLVGTDHTNLFRTLNLKTRKVNLELLKSKMLDKNYILLIYKIKK